MAQWGSLRCWEVLCQGLCKDVLKLAQYIGLLWAASCDCSGEEVKVATLVGLPIGGTRTKGREGPRSSICFCLEFMASGSLLVVLLDDGSHLVVNLSQGEVSFSETHLRFGVRCFGFLETT